jgi:hypothetical protein
VGGVVAGGGAAATYLGLNPSLLPFVGSEPAAFTRWIPEADEIDGSDHLETLYLDATTITDSEDQFDEEYYDSQVETFDFPTFDLDLEDVEDIAITFTGGEDSDGGTFLVLLGSFDTEDIGETLEDEDQGTEMDEDGSHNDYDLYVPESGDDGESLSATVSDAALVLALGRGDDFDALAVTETVIDAEAGEVARHVDEHERFRKVATEIGSATRINIETFEERDESAGWLEGSVASGFSQTVTGEKTDIKRAILFDSKSDLEDDDEDDEETETESAPDEETPRGTEAADQSADDDEDESIWDKANNVDRTEDGRLLTITGTLDTDELEADD